MVDHFRAYNNYAYHGFLNLLDAQIVSYESKLKFRKTVILCN